MDCRSLTEAGWFTTVLKSCSLWLSDPYYCSSVWCSVDNTNNCTLIAVASAVCFGRQNNIYATKQKLFLCLHQNTVRILHKWNYKKFENIFVSNIHLIILRYVFNKKYKQRNRSENIYELFIANWSYSYDK